MSCGGGLDGPRLDRWLGDVEVVHGTNYVVPPTRRPAVVSVYDCWFLTHPAQADAACAAPVEVLRRRVRAGATVHASSHATATRCASVLGAERVEVIHLGPLAVPDASPPGHRSRGRRRWPVDPFVLALGTLERRKNLPRSSAAFDARRRRRTPTPGSSSPGRPATTGPPSTRPSTRSARRCAARRCGRAPSTTPTKAWLLRHARVLAYPSLDEGFGFPLLDAQQAGLPVVATRRRLDPRGRRRRRRCWSPSATSTPSPAPSPRCSTTTTRRSELIAAGRRTWPSSPGRPTATALVHALPPAAREPMTVTVLCGGVGAARFLRGLLWSSTPRAVTAVVNTGDDTTLHGLSISPDLDTITYTLAGAIDPERGWGLAGETWQAMGGPRPLRRVRPAGSSAATTWFNLGDRDLATHLYRTARLAEGASPTAVAAEVAPGVGPRAAVAADDRRACGHDRSSWRRGRGRLVPGLLRAAAATAWRCAACASAATAPRPTPEVRAALEPAATIVVAPSNPIVSIGPLRALPASTSCCGRRREHVVAVSPIVGGAALKGPADHMLAELGHEPSVVGVARLYAPIAAALVDRSRRRRPRAGGRGGRDARRDRRVGDVDPPRSPPTWPAAVLAAVS